jgi:putative RecB family exonuclease
MIEISASKLTTYMDCPLKYKLRYVDRIEPEETSAGLAMGSAFHRTIKHYYSRLMDGQRLDSEQLEVAFRQDWEVAQTVPIGWNGEGPEELERQGIELLRAYLESTGDPSTPIAVEADFKLPLVNIVTGERLEGVQL